MKKFFIISILVLLCIISGIPFTYASSTTVISLSDSKITVNGKTISTDTSSSIYLSNKMDNGGTSDDATNSNIEVSNIININSAGTYNVQSLADGINACRESESVITINGGTVIVNILNDADEGDGIDSNGYIYINGGTVYAFAHPGSDNGLDSDSGTYIDGGTVDDNNIYTSIESIDLSSMTKQENNTMNNRGPGRPGDFRNTETTTSKNNTVIKYVIIGVLITIIVFIIGITIFSFTKKK